ncbi:hypothetical protein BH23VER1_BH23VER1_36890 [soil metagenome]
MKGKTEPPPIPPPLPPEEEARVSALASRACPKCGGKAEWSPRQRSLVCPYCNFVLDSRSAVSDEDSIIKEHDLHETLRTVEEASRGIEQGQRKIHCRHCNADSLSPVGTVADRCPFCGSPEIVTYDDIGSVIRPESLLPKAIPESQAYSILKKWAGSRFWAPNDLKRKNLVDHMKGIYLPYWTFDAEARCPWTADSGTYYYVNVRGADGKTRRQRRTRWTPASGRVDYRFDDVSVPATEFVPPDELHAIEPFPTKDLVPYDIVYISGWTVEHYAVSLLDGAKRGRQIMQATLRNMAASDVPGDTYRNLKIFPEYSAETFKHILVPVWVISYDYRQKLFRTVVNGYTGKVAGKYPISAWKVFFAVLLGLIVLAVVLFFMSQR